MHWWALVVSVGLAQHCITGGSVNSSTQLSQTECWDEVTEQWTIASNWSLVTPREGMSVATIAGNWCVLGGFNGQLNPNYLSSIECFNGSQWNSMKLRLPRIQAYAAVLQFVEGVCLAGGSDGNHTLNTLDCYDPNTTSFVTRNTTLQTARMGATALPLPDGRWCVVGGMGSGTLDEVECFTYSGESSGISHLPFPSAWGILLNIQGQDCLVAGSSPDSRLVCVTNASNAPFFALHSISFPMSNLTGASSIPFPGSSRDAPCVGGGILQGIRQTACYCFDSFSSLWYEPESWKLTSPRSSLGFFIANALQGKPTTSTTTSPTTSPTASPTASPTISTVSPTASPTTSPTASPTGRTHAPSIPSGSGGSPSPTSSPPLFSLLVTGGPTPTLSVPSSFFEGDLTTFRCSSTCVWTFPPAYSASLASKGSSITIPPWTFLPGHYTVSASKPGSGNSDRLAYANFTVLAEPLQISISGGSVVSICMGHTANFTASWPSNSTRTPTTLTWSTSPACQPFLSISSNKLTAMLGPGLPALGTVCTIQLNASTSLVWKNLSVITTVSNSPLCTLRISGPSTVASTDILRLVAVVPDDAIANLALFWTSSPALLRAGCLLTGNSRALAVASDCLTPGYTTFTVTAITTQNGDNASASMQILAVYPPFGGQCSVMMSTPVEIDCFGWMSSVSGQLRYSLWNSSFTSILTPLSDPESEGNFTVLLAPGTYNLTVQIASIDGSTTWVPLAVVVIQPNACAQLATIDLVPNDGSPAAIQQARVEFACGPSLAQWSNLQAALEVGFQRATASTSLLGVAVTEWVLGASRPQVTPSPLLSDAFATTLESFLSNLVHTSDLSSSIAAVIVASLDTLLSVAPCSTVNQLLIYVSELSVLAGQDRLPGENAVLLDIGTALSVQSSVVFTDSMTESSSSNVLVQLPSDLPITTSDQSGTVQAVITDYSSDIERCRAPQSGRLLTGISDVVLSTDNGLLSVKNSNSPIVLTFTARPPACGKAVCVWWDASANDWTMTGCQSSRGALGTYICSCNHLTEFSLLLAGCPTQAERNGYAVFIAAYSVVGTIALAKLIYRLYFDSIAAQSSGIALRRRWTVLHTQHTLIALLCLTRALVAAVLGQFLQTTFFDLRAALLVGPYLLFFWIYTLMVFQWAALQHFPLARQQESFKIVRPCFLALNLAQCIAIVTLFAMLMDSHSTRSISRAAVISGVIVAVLTMITAGSFLFYATTLYRTMIVYDDDIGKSIRSRSNTTPQPSRPSSRENSVTTRPRGCSFGVSQKLLFFGAAISLFLAAEGALQAVTAAAAASAQESGETADNLDQAHTVELLLLFCDIMAVISMLALYHKSMHDVPDNRRKTLRMTQTHGSKHRAPSPGPGSRVGVEKASQEGTLGSGEGINGSSTNPKKGEPLHVILANEGPVAQ